MTAFLLYVARMERESRQSLFFEFHGDVAQPRLRVIGLLVLVRKSLFIKTISARFGKQVDGLFV